MAWPSLPLDRDWTLFLDRDGVINQRLPGAYVSHFSDFIFEDRALEALAVLAAHFAQIIIVTNQQGVGKGLMEATDLIQVHEQMLEEIEQAGGRIDGVYYCTELATNPDNCRKPQPKMALQAQQDFPAIDFQRSIMVGDSISDMEFGQNLGMQMVWIEGKAEEREKALTMAVDGRFLSLWEMACALTQDP